MQSALNALNPVMTVEDQIKDVLEIHKNITSYVFVYFQDIFNLIFNSHYRIERVKGTLHYNGNLFPSMETNFHCNAKCP